jgi:hypothetical protein
MASKELIHHFEEIIGALIAEIGYDAVTPTIVRLLRYHVCGLSIAVLTPISPFLS